MNKQNPTYMPSGEWSIIGCFMSIDTKEKTTIMRYLFHNEIVNKIGIDIEYDDFLNSALTLINSKLKQYLNYFGIYKWIPCFNMSIEYDLIKKEFIIYYYHDFRLHYYTYYNVNTNITINKLYDIDKERLNYIYKQYNLNFDSDEIIGTPVISFLFSNIASKYKASKYKASKDIVSKDKTSKDIVSKEYLN